MYPPSLPNTAYVRVRGRKEASKQGIPGLSTSNGMAKVPDIDGETMTGFEGERLDTSFFMKVTWSPRILSVRDCAKPVHAMHFYGHCHTRELAATII